MRVKEQPVNKRGAASQPGFPAQRVEKHNVNKCFLKKASDLAQGCGHALSAFLIDE